MTQNRRLVWDAESKRTASIVAILLLCLALIGRWVEVGVSVLLAEGPVSVRGIVACLAFTVAGIGAGVLMAGFTVWYARRRGRAVPEPEPGSEHTGLFFLLLGLASLGSGLDYALQPAPTGWALFSIWFFSTGGGALMGFSLVLSGRGKFDRVPGGPPTQGACNQRWQVEIAKPMLPGIAVSSNREGGAHDGGQNQTGPIDVVQ
jgi:hypothetical protein